jgi:hypothetical protein
VSNDVWVEPDQKMNKLAGDQDPSLAPKAERQDVLIGLRFSELQSSINKNI